MKIKITSALGSLIMAALSLSSFNADAQVFGPVSNLRPYDKSGIHVLEDLKLTVWFLTASA